MNNIHQTLYPETPAFYRTGHMNYSGWRMYQICTTFFYKDVKLAASDLGHILNRQCLGKGCGDISTYKVMEAEKVHIKFCLET